MTFAGAEYGPSTTPPANATTYSITPSGLTSGVYEITFVAGTFTINKMPAAVRAVGASKTYGDVDPALTTIHSGIWDSLDVPPLTFSATRAPGETATTYVMTPTASDSGTGRLNNYDVTYLTGTFTITRKAASVTPNAASKTYGGTDPTLTGTLTGFLVGDGVAASYSRTAGETVLGSPYAISATLSPAGVLANYNITSNTAAFTITRAATSTALTSSLNPATYGQAITLTATVTSTAGVPTGSVTFTDGVTTLGSAPVNVSGVATLVVSLPAGARALTATYSGNSNFDGSAGNLTESMAIATTSTTLSSSPNQSSPGQPVNFVATVIGQFGGAVTGVVTFKKGPNPIGTAPMIANGTATLTLSNLGTGPHVVTATYGGDSNSLVSSSSSVTQNVVAPASPTTTTVSSSLNPSIAGQQVTLTAVVTSGSPGTPTGTITFRRGQTLLATVAMTNGQATYGTSTLPVGSLGITAVYGGDAQFITSTSASLNQVVAKASTTITLSSTPNPSTFGQLVTFTATVSSSIGVIATGVVEFVEGSTTHGSATLNAAGNATFSITTLPLKNGKAATHSVKAKYLGDANNQNSTSTTLAQTVQP
jgi:hypothetical protein